MKIKLIYIIIGIIIISLILYLMLRKPKEILPPKVKKTPGIVQKPVPKKTPQEEFEPPGTEGMFG